MAAVAQAKTLTPGFANEKKVARVIYDGTVDSKSTGALDLAVAGGTLIVSRVIANVLTGVTATGAATVAVGKTGSATAIIDTTAGAKANLDAATKVVASSNGVKLAAGEAIIQTIGGDALLTGKIEYIIEYYAA